METGIWESVELTSRKWMTSLREGEWSEKRRWCRMELRMPAFNRWARGGERPRACRRPAGEKEGLGHRWQARCLGGIFWQVSVVSLATCVFCSHFVLLERCLTCSLLRYNAHTIKVTTSKCTVFWYTCKVVQLSPQSNSRTFSSHLQRCPIPISSHSLFPLPSAPGNL